MKIFHLIWVFVGVSILCTSCVATSIATKDDVDHVNVRQSSLGSELTVQKHSLEALQLELQQVSRDNGRSINNIHKQLRIMEENVVQLQESIRSVKDIVHSLQQDSQWTKSQVKSFEKKFDLVLDEVAHENERILRQMKKLYPKGPGLHVVKKGETLSRISSRYGVSIDDLIIINDLKDVDQIYVGQKLRISEE